MRIDEITYHVKIDGQELPDRGCSISELQIIEKYEYAVPCLILRIQDEANAIGRSIILNDGSRLELTWGHGSNVFTHTFRVATYVVDSSANTYFYDITAWLDVVPWFVDCNNKSYAGNSSDVIKKIAEECGMVVEVDPTDDNQKWIGGNDPNFLFARKIARKGYGGKDALMGIACCLGRKPVVRYKDLNKLDDEGPKLGFVHGMGIPKKQKITGFNVNCLPLTSCRVHLRSGIYNLIHGYKAVMKDPNIDDPDTDGTQENAPVKTRTNNLSVNSNIRDEVTTPKLQTGRVKTDNTHKNYNAAEYSNNRGSYTLQNAKIEITTNYLTNLTIFDPVAIKLSGVNVGVTSSDENSQGQFDGPYIVYCRTIFISGNTYAEKLVCKREGMMG